MADISRRDKGWRVRWYDPDGKRRSRQCRTRRDADALAADVESSRSRGERWEPRGLRPDPELREVMKEYLHELAREGLASGTVYGRGMIMEYLARFMESQKQRRRGPVRLSALNRDVVAAWIDADLERGLKRSTLANHAAMAHQLVEFAAAEYPQICVPFRRVRIRAEAKRAPRPPTLAQLDTCIDALDNLGERRNNLTDEARKGAILMRFTGLRPFQVAQLRWSDFDLAAAEMDVRPELGKTRREQAGRVVPIAPELVKEMATWGRREGDVCALKLPTLKGWVKKAWAGTDLDPSLYLGQTSKAFRGSWQTWLRSQRVQLDVIRWLVGHALGGATDAYVGSSAFMAEAREAVALLPPRGADRVVPLPHRREG